MNCVKGDLAFTKGAPMDNDILVEVLELREVHSVYGQLWLIRSLGSPFHITPTILRDLAVWPDCMLRPIRHPGDDAVDESLQWLRIPEVDTV